MDLNGVRSAAGRVTAAIQSAAEATGVDFDYLLRTARRESALNPSAQARTSSAAGLFQFVDQTWLATVRRHGANHGYGRFAEMITSSGGRYRAVSPEARAELMQLRLNPEAASLMAAELTSDSAAYLRGRIGREPSSGELYAAHFLGPAGCARLILACEANPQASAVALFPDAAAANRSIFYRDGRPATVSEVHANLMRHHEGGPAVRERPDPVPQVREAVAAVEAQRSPTLAAALARIRAQQAMVSMILGQGDAGGAPSFGSAGRSPTDAYRSQIENLLLSAGGPNSDSR